MQGKRKSCACFQALLPLVFCSASERGEILLFQELNFAAPLSQARPSALQRKKPKGIRNSFPIFHFFPLTHITAGQNRNPLFTNRARICCGNLRPWWDWRRGYLLLNGNNSETELSFLSHFSACFTPPSRLTVMVIFRQRFTTVLEESPASRLSSFQE